MKKCLIVSLMILIPFTTWARDYCTNPDLYTVDKRCYVTDEEKAQKPYNSTVALITSTDNDPMCTGAIVKIQDALFVYTAAHCVIYKNKKEEQIHIQLQDGKKIIASYNNAGNFNSRSQKVQSTDWAVYHIPEQYNDIAYTNVTNKIYSSSDTEYDATAVGYGSLKIMSDKDINDFKQKYINYLNEINKAQNLKNGIMPDGGIHLNMNTVQHFLSQTLKEDEPDYYKDLFDNTELKKSQCKYTSQGTGINCQAWRGNSGSPIFDNDGNIIGIITDAYSIIGGEMHGLEAGSIPLLQEQDTNTD